MIINGKHYPLWSQFVERKNEFIGGLLQDLGDIDTGKHCVETLITDISLSPNGRDSAYFLIAGINFSCGFDCRYGGISGNSDPDWITFSGYGGHTFRIKAHGERT